MVHKLSDWLFLTKVGECIAILMMLVICLAFAGGVVLASMYMDETKPEPVKIEHTKPQINEPLMMAYSGLGLIGIVAAGRKRFKT